MIHDLRARDDAPLTVKCAVCIIGGGIAGLISASGLSTSGRRVVVLESGDQKPLRQFDAFNLVEQTVETYQHAVDGRVRALGGTSNTWGGRIIPLTHHDMMPRDYLGLSGWPIARADLDGFTPDIERLFRLDQTSYEELPASPSRLDDNTLSGSHQDMIARWPKWPTFRRRNVALLLRHTVAIKRNPEIWLNATVFDLLFDGVAGRLTGVTAKSVNGKRLTVTADWFILAAGPGEVSTWRPLSALSAETKLRAATSQFAPSCLLARSITTRAIWESRCRLVGSRSLCRRPRSPRIWAAWRRPFIGEFAINRCISAHPSTFSSTLGSSKSPTRFHASRFPSSEMNLARRCWGWTGGRRIPTNTPFARFCFARAGFGDPLFFTPQARSPGRSIPTKTIWSSRPWTPAILPERLAWARIRADPS